MKSPRLLPVVIFAAFALLIVKGIAVISDGSYILSGIARAQASEGAASVDVGTSAPTMKDTAPTLEDHAPTLPGEKGGNTATATPNHGGKPTELAKIEPAKIEPAKTVPAGTVPARTDIAAVGTANANTPAHALDCILKPSDPLKNGGKEGHGAPAIAGDLINSGCPLPPDAVPTKLDATGKKIPLAGTDGTSLTQQTLLTRLGERRAELDKREKDINVRMALVQAAEKQMQSRTAALKKLQDQINALVDEKKAMQDSQFVAIVNMYETMKPRDAANIFDGLDMSVLARVAKAMNPRKMAPIMAQMSTKRAQELTVTLAGIDAGQPAQAMASTQPGGLPQIVGH